MDYLCANATSGIQLLLVRSVAVQPACFALAVAALFVRSGGALAVRLREDRAARFTKRLDVLATAGFDARRAGVCLAASLTQ